MTRTDHPVVVVGASAAGLYVAHQLARAGMPVHVCEAARSVDPVPRTLIVTHKFREQMGSLAESAILNEIRRFELFADDDQATVELDRPDLIIERAEVIRVLADQARSAGAVIETGLRLVGLEPSGSNGSAAAPEGAIRLEFQRHADEDGGADRETRFADVVVGADGSFSTTSKLAGWPQQPIVPLAQAIVALPADIAPDSSRVWFVPEDTPYFYWLIPESPGRAALGIIGEADNGSPRVALEGFLARQGLEPIEFQGGKIPRYARWIRTRRAVGKGDVFLVGDAAGQVKVTTVGGIVTGFRGAQGVVDALLRPRSGSGETRALRRELDLHLLIRRAMHDFDAKEYGKLLRLLSGSARSTLGKYHRDETWRLMANLLLRQPRLAAMGLKNLIFGG